MGTSKTKLDISPGTLDMLVLKILLRGHLHGYAIANQFSNSRRPRDIYRGGNGIDRGRGNCRVYPGMEGVEN